MARYQDAHDAPQLAAAAPDSPAHLGFRATLAANPYAAPGAAVAETLYSRTLLAIDFGPASLAAARWATTHVAPGTHGVLVHVVPFPDGGSAPEDASKPESLRQLTPTLLGGLGGFAATLEVASSRGVLRIGSPSRWLSTIANDGEAGLLVLGRRGDANRVRVGEPNVIERAARRTSASVLVVPEGTAQPPGQIVAAVDHSRAAPHVLRVARRLAWRHEVPLTVLHVLSPAVGAYERVIRTARQLQDAGDTRSRAPQKPAKPTALPARPAKWLVDLARAHDLDEQDGMLVAMGDPTREIIRIATASDAPLVVVGVRGADKAPAGSIGSVARELLTRAPLPVLAVNVL